MGTGLGVKPYGKQQKLTPRIPRQHTFGNLQSLWYLQNNSFCGIKNGTNAIIELSRIY